MLKKINEKSINLNLKIILVIPVHVLKLGRFARKAQKFHFIVSISTRNFLQIKRQNAEKKYTKLDFE